VSPPTRTRAGEGAGEGAGGGAGGGDELEKEPEKEPVEEPVEEPVKPYRRRAAARCVSLLLSSCTVFSKPLNFFPERFFHNKRKDLSVNC
jgi:hypothetical protein